MEGVKKLKIEKENVLTNIGCLEQSSPDDLMTICVAYIAAHLHLVDSLEYFPDIVGVKIFDKAMQLEQFKGSDKASAKRLELFCVAYQEMMLISLHLSSHHLCLNNYYDQFALFLHLKCLDVSSNGLGDDHEILHHLSFLKSLETLSLRNNCLSDDGLRKLTSPLRMLRQGAMELRNLDVSENAEISCKGVKYVKCFQKLEILNVSYTSIDPQSEIDGWSMATSCSDILSTKFSFETKGWAEQVIETWKSVCKAAAAKKPAGKYKKGFQQKTKTTVGTVRTITTNVETRRILNALTNKEKTEENNNKTDKIIGVQLILVKVVKGDNISVKLSNKTSKSNNSNSKQHRLKNIKTIIPTCSNVRTKESETKCKQKNEDDDEDDLMKKMYGSVPDKSKSLTL